MSIPLPKLDSRTTLTDRVYENLRDLILQGKLAPGAKITESEIASQMGISITPVREAFLKLEAAGLLIVRPRAAAQVTKLSLNDLRQLTMIRAALEQAILQPLMDNITEEQLQSLRSTLASLGELKDRDDWDSYARTHRLFHDLLLEPARCPMIKRMVMDAFDAGQRYWRTVQTSSPELWERDHRYHTQLLDAIERRDKDAANLLLSLDHKEYPNIVTQAVRYEKRPFSAFFSEAADEEKAFGNQGSETS